MSKPGYLTASFYKFVSFSDADCQALQRALREQCVQHDITGTILIATEGINGTICGGHAGVHQVLQWLRTDPRLAMIESKESVSAELSLSRLKIRIKPEIITMGQPDIDPATQAGTYVDPHDWNALISRPDVVVIDARNDYEVTVGRFTGATDPQTDNFSDLPAWLDDQPALAAKPPVAMYCTGGIRCEKSTALLKSKGFTDVYHLRGGILKYLETIDEKDSLFEGECFVFDDRVAVNHQLQPGTFALCYGCGHPISQSQMDSPRYVPGKSCDYCFERNGAETSQN